MMSDNEKIVSRIDSLAKSKGTSIAEIERSVGFGNGKIGKWKKAPKSPPFESLSVVANHLETTIAYLTGETDDPSAGIKKDPVPKDGAVSQEKQLLLDMIDGLSDEQKELLALSKKMSDDELKRFIAAMKAMLGESM
jgi:hypothetical protein